jgi:hypothetical protein
VKKPSSNVQSLEASSEPAALKRKSLARNIWRQYATPIMFAVLLFSVVFVAGLAVLKHRATLCAEHCVSIGAKQHKYTPFSHIVGGVKEDKCHCIP